MNERVVRGRGSNGSLDLDVDLAALGDERDFLLSSLRDLEAEHDAGDIDEVDFQTLRDDYTVRTADVLRAIERARQPSGKPGREVKRAGRRRVAGGSNGPTTEQASLGTVSDEGVSGGVGGDVAAAAVGDEVEGDDLSSAGAARHAQVAKRTKTRWRLAAIVMTVLLFGAIAGWAVTATSGSRVSGQSITGNSNLRSPVSTPSAVESSLAKAATMVNTGKVGDALKLYDQILKQTPNQPEAEANSGWLIAQTGLAVKPVRTDLVDEGLARILVAEKAAPTYADPHFFRGFLLLRAKNDPVDAVTELRIYLGTVDPSSPGVPAVEQVLKEAIAAAGPNVPPGPNAPTTAPSGPSGSPSTRAVAP